MTPLEPVVVKRNSDRCKKCQAEILWATTPKGKVMPIDPDQVYGGNVALRADDVGMLRASSVRAAGDVEAYVTHFSSCPNADEFRRVEFAKKPGASHEEQHEAKMRALQVLMPFGKHAGKTLEEIDRNDSRYLRWAAEKLEFRNRELGAAVKLIAGLES